MLLVNSALMMELKIYNVHTVYNAIDNNTHKVIHKYKPACVKFSAMFSRIPAGSANISSSFDP